MIPLLLCTVWETAHDGHISKCNALTPSSTVQIECSENYLKMYLKFQVFWGRERCATGGYATLVCLYIPRKMDDYDDVRYYFCVQHSGVV